MNTNNDPNPNSITDDISGNSLFSQLRVPEWYIGILDSIETGILIVNESAVALYINPAYTRITGVTRDKIIGRVLSEVRPNALLPKVVQTGKSMFRVFQNVDDIEFVSDIFPIRVGGKIVGGVGIQKDITEVKRLAKELGTYIMRAERLRAIINDAYRAKYHFEDIIGSSKAIIEAIRVSRKIARGENDILISGESGTGKEVFAQSIHNASFRSAGPFIPVSCATLTSSLIDSELFGYEDGAFTDAKKGGRVGLFEAADHGTIFLDEIDALPLAMQPKLLRALQERTIRRVGNNLERNVDVRVIAATNRNIKTLIKEGAFREDLFYRLDVMSIQLPPLRDRNGDIPLLADHFLKKITENTGQRMTFSPEVHTMLSCCEWPGNVRELLNVVEYSAKLAENSMINLCDLPRKMRFDYLPSPTKGGSLTEIIHKIEREIIQERLRSYGSNLAAKKRIASDLGISLASLYNKIKPQDPEGE